MKLHDATTELRFEARIDAMFPYGDQVACSELIDEARNTSLNALFCVLDEICRPPKNSAVTPERQRQLIAEWSAIFEHELKEPLLRCADALVSDRRLPWPEAKAVIEQVGRFEGQRAALSVAYFSGDCDSDEGNAVLVSAERSVRDTWEKMAI